MKKLEIANKIIDLVKSEINDGGLANLLIRNHNLIAHQLRVEEWYDSTQGDLFTLWRIVELIQKVEKDFNDGNIE